LSSRLVARCTGAVRGAVVFAALLLVSCTAGSDRETTPNPDTSGSATTSAADCPVTLPNGHRPPGDQDGLASRLSHGSGGLWVELYPRGIVRPAYYGRAWPNGTIAVKFPWTRGVPGHLKITGRRLDADAPDLQSSVPSGYGRTGFQSSGVLFPATGCWEVTGRVGSASLTFVTEVLGPRSS
jgi:hypothetical protein